MADVRASAVSGGPSAVGDAAGAGHDGRPADDEEHGVLEPGRASAAGGRCNGGRRGGRRGGERGRGGGWGRRRRRRRRCFRRRTCWSTGTVPGENNGAARCGGACCNCV